MNLPSAQDLPQGCPERKSLEEEHNWAEAVFNSSHLQLQARMGISDKAEYQRLDGAVDVAWQALNKARKRLHEHLVEHGCGSTALPRPSKSTAPG